MRGWLIALLVVVAVWLGAIVALVAVGRRWVARELLTLIPNLVALFRGLVGDARVPMESKILLLVAVVWIASPVDLVPEFIPIAGPLDDAIVAGFVLRHVVRRAGRDVVSAHWRGNPKTLERILRLARSD